VAQSEVHPDRAVDRDRVTDEHGDTFDRHRCRWDETGPRRRRERPGQHATGQDEEPWPTAHEGNESGDGADPDRQWCGQLRTRADRGGECKDGAIGHDTLPGKAMARGSAV
jgi:hypothetical protein